jgi:shikimate kinase
VEERLMNPSRSLVDKHVVLIGLMGTGKTTTGTRLAARLHREFLDNDVLLERRTGATAETLRRERGEEALHHLEADVLLSCLAERPLAVIAAAASTVLNPIVRDALRESAFVVWLRTDLQVLSERLADPGSRPLDGDAAEVLARQGQERAPIYAALADVELNTSTRTVDELVDDLMGSPH